MLSFPGNNPLNVQDSLNKLAGALQTANKGQNQQMTLVDMKNERPSMLDDINT